MQPPNEQGGQQIPPPHYAPPQGVPGPQPGTPQPVPPGVPPQYGQVPPAQPGQVPPGYGAPQYGGPPQPMTPNDERLWATLIHIGSLFFSFLAPLIAYLVLRDRGPFVRAHAATALNFQLTLVIAYIVGTILTFVLIGVFVIIAAYVLNIIFCIIAAVKANQGAWYQYPLAIRFVS